MHTPESTEGSPGHRLNRLKGANLVVDVSAANPTATQTNKRAVMMEPESPAFEFDFMATGRSKLKALPKIKEESAQQDDGRTLSVIKESKLSNQGGANSADNGEPMSRLGAPSVKNFGLTEPALAKSRNESIYPQDTVFEGMSRKGIQTYASRNEGMLAQSIDKQIKMASRRKSSNFKDVQNFLTLGQDDESETPEGIKTPPLKKIVSEVVENPPLKRRGEGYLKKDFERANTNPTVGAANLMEESAVIAKFDDRFEKIGNNAVKPKEHAFVPAAINESQPPPYQFAVVQRKFSNDSLDEADPHNIQNMKGPMKRSMTMGGDPRRNSKSVQDLGQLERRNEGPFIIPVKAQHVTVSDSRDASDSNIHESRELLAEFQKEKRLMEEKIKQLEKKLLAISNKPSKVPAKPNRNPFQLQSDFETITEEDSHSGTKNKQSGGELGNMSVSKHPATYKMQGSSHSRTAKSNAQDSIPVRLVTSGKSGSKGAPNSRSVGTQTQHTPHNTNRPSDHQPQQQKDRRLVRAFHPAELPHCPSCCPHTVNRTHVNDDRHQATRAIIRKRLKPKERADLLVRTSAYSYSKSVIKSRTVSAQRDPSAGQGYSPSFQIRVPRPKSPRVVLPEFEYTDDTHQFGLSLALV